MNYGNYGILLNIAAALKYSLNSYNNRVFVRERRVEAGFPM
jgi:hypothetical protein